MTDEKLEELVDAVAKACADSCCGDNSAGIMAGADVVLGVLAPDVSLFRSPLRERLREVENRLWEEAQKAHGEEEP